MHFTVFAAVVCLAGLLVHLIAQNPVIKNLAFGCFVAGLAASLVLMGGKPVSLPGR